MPAGRLERWLHSGLGHIYDTTSESSAQCFIHDHAQDLSLRNLVASIC
jgi:hypothetical protein